MKDEDGLLNEKDEDLAMTAYASSIAGGDEKPANSTAAAQAPEPSSDGELDLAN